MTDIHSWSDLLCARHHLKLLGPHWSTALVLLTPSTAIIFLVKSIRHRYDISLDFFLLVERMNSCGGSDEVILSPDDRLRLLKCSLYLSQDVCSLSDPSQLFKCLQYLLYSFNSFYSILSIHLLKLLLTSNSHYTSMVRFIISCLSLSSSSGVIVKTG